MLLYHALSLVLLALFTMEIAEAARGPILNALFPNYRRRPRHPRPRPSSGGGEERVDPPYPAMTPTPTLTTVPLPYLPTTFDSAVCAAYPEICYNAGLLPTGKK